MHVSLPLHRVLDISFNRIRKIENLDGMTKLKKLFLCANKISRVENVNHLKSLELLELGDNKIRVRSGFFLYAKVFLLRHSCLFSNTLFFSTGDREPRWVDKPKKYFLG